MIELKHLKSLSAIQAYGNLVEAAEHLHTTQSALSHQIKELEHKLDNQLFIRKSKPMVFTATGQRLLALAEDVLPMVRLAELDLQRLAGGDTGRLNIAIECHSCFKWLMPTLDNFRDECPDVEVDIVTGFNFAPLPALVRGDIDLVITSDPQELDNISYFPLFTYQSLLAVSNKCELSKHKFVTPQMLEPYTLITYPVDKNILDIFKDFLDPAGCEPAAIRTTELTVMMMQLVASGRGIAALPEWALVEYLEKDYVRSSKLGPKGVWNTLYAAIRSEQADFAYIKHFLLLAKEVSLSNLQGIKAVKQ